MTKTEKHRILSAVFHLSSLEPSGAHQEGDSDRRPSTDPGVNPTSLTHKFLFQAESTHPADLWKREGRGTAQFLPKNDGLCLIETGYWTEDGSGESVRFTASWEFQPLPEDGIEIAHNRTGPATPLVRLFPNGENRWASRSPHLCGDDRYHACLTAKADGGFRLEWTATGPHKQYRLLREYRGAPEIAPIRASTHSTD